MKEKIKHETIETVRESVILENICFVCDGKNKLYKYVKERDRLLKKSQSG